MRIYIYIWVWVRPPHGMFDGSCPASIPRGIAPPAPPVVWVGGWAGGWVVLLGDISDSCCIIIQYMIMNHDI